MSVGHRCPVLLQAARCLGAIEVEMTMLVSMILAGGLTLGGIPGVLLATYLVKELSVYSLLWLVVVVLLYPSVTLWASSQSGAPAAA